MVDPVRGGIFVRSAECRREIAAEKPLRQRIRGDVDELDLQPRDRARDFRQRIGDQASGDAAGQADPEGRDRPLLELLGMLAGRLRGGIGLFEHRQHELAEVGELRELAFAVNELAAQFLLELLDRLRQGRLRDEAFLGRAREVERSRKRKKIADLVHLHDAAPSLLWLRGGTVPANTPVISRLSGYTPGGGGDAHQVSAVSNRPEGPVAGRSAALSNS